MLPVLHPVASGCCIWRGLPGNLELLISVGPKTTLNILRGNTGLQLVRLQIWTWWETLRATWLRYSGAHPMLSTRRGLPRRLQFYPPCFWMLVPSLLLSRLTGYGLPLIGFVAASSQLVEIFDFMLHRLVLGPGSQGGGIPRSDGLRVLLYDEVLHHEGNPCNIHSHNKYKVTHLEPRFSNIKEWFKRSFFMLGSGWEFPASEATCQEFPLRAMWGVVPNDKEYFLDYPFCPSFSPAKSC